MEIPKDLSAENITFAKEKNILNDIAQETKDAPGYGCLSEDELMEKVENILLEKIKEGQKQAFFQLGLFYYEQGVYEKAIVYFERSKDFDFQSLYMLSVMLYDGVGCKSDTKKAVEYMRKIALSDDKRVKHLIGAAQFNLGRAYFQGYGVGRQSDVEAEKYWLLAADDGNPKASVKAQSTLGMFYCRDDSLNLTKAFFWHSEACGNGSLESQGALGVMYEYGVGVRSNKDSAYVCLKEASDRGNVYAMGNLVANYYKRKLYTKAADLASRVSQLSDVGLISKETDCLPSFICKGIAMSCFYYARCLHAGHGVKKDENEAKKYYSRCYQFDPDVCASLQNQTQHGKL
ncbi:LRP2-binding protein-like isoform X2 [Ruditapes philippinarum]|uniref:LRP2-binding protein-like isoform X2 n=1 Tax=Ruditapes philippinarum TaxID=129788 RepID=UPI00295AACA5|nr:LRP2-binding protein-like isoform X2 [Ruditapes philippinarum]